MDVAPRVPPEPTLPGFPDGCAVAYLSAVTRHSPAGIGLLDREFCYRHVNEALATFNGLPAADHIGRCVRDVVPHLWPTLEPIYRRVRDTGESVTNVAVIGEVASQPGRVREWRGNYHPVRDADGAVIGIVIVVVERTDADRAEEERRRQERRFRALVEDGTDAVVVLDREWGRKYVSPAVTRLFGWSADEFVTLLSKQIVHPEDFDRVIGVFQRAMTVPGTPIEDRHRVQHKDGSWRWVEATITSLFHDPAVDGLVINARDVTEQTRIQQLHRETEGRLTATLQSTPNVAVQWYDRSGRVTFWNHASEQVFGWTAAEAEGQTLDRLIHTPAEFTEFLDTCGRIARTGETVGPAEFSFRRKDGSAGRCLSTLFAIPGPAGEPWFACMDVDVTALRDLETRLHHAQKLEAVGRLAGGIAHDFNNLLTVINGCSTLLLDQLAPGDPLRELVGEIARGGERAGTLTRQLLAFSRQQVIEPRMLNLNVALADAEKLLRRLIGEDVILSANLFPNLGLVKADAGQVEQVLVNLVVNARDAMPRGGRLTVETQNVTLDADYCRLVPEVAPGEFVLLAVSDTGAGMDEAVRARVFEPFFTTKPMGKGSGLGLATVHGIVKQARGHVSVYSEVNRGTTFKVYLPREYGPPMPAPPVRPAQASLPPGTETVLLVEDEAAVRALARHTLRKCGYAVLEAGDGAEALRVAGGHAGPIQLLVSDVVMPHLGGRELVERLTVARPNCRVLFLSGYTDDAIVRHGVLAAEYAFLQKPFTPTTLAQKVRAVLDTAG